MEEFNESGMGLILHSGNAKNSAMKALRFARKHEFDEAEKHLKEAREHIGEAHQSQTNLLHKEANGDTTTVSLLMVHAQDHMMNTLSFIDSTDEMIYLYKEIYKLKKEE